MIQTNENDLRETQNVESLMGFYFQFWLISHLLFISCLKYFFHFQVCPTKMCSLNNRQWCMSGHDLIFQKIMMMVGLDSPETLHRCEQVCTAWNAMIMQNIWESPSKRNIIKMRIEKNWSPGIFPSDEDISHAKWLGKKNNGLQNLIYKYRSLFQKTEASLILD